MNTTNERIKIAPGLWVDALGRINLGYGVQTRDIGSLHDDACVKAFAAALVPAPAMSAVELAEGKQHGFSPIAMEIACGLEGLWQKDKVTRGQVAALVDAALQAHTDNLKEAK